jgi:hypothetical protein
MRSCKWTAVGLAVVLIPSEVSAGYCDLVFRWDQQAIDACIRELKSEISVLRLRAQTEESLNQIMRNNLCLLAMDVKTENAASIAEIACAELRDNASARKNAARGQKAGRVGPIPVPSSKP